MTKEQFHNEIKERAIYVRTTLFPEWRYGQTIFNILDIEYGIARTIQFKHGIDCFYCDQLVDKFLDKAYELLNN